MDLTCSVKEKRKTPLERKDGGSQWIGERGREKRKNKDKKRKLEGMEGDWKRRRKPFSAVFSITVVVEKLTK